MFVFNENWLRHYYGSHGQQQIQSSEDWLYQYGQNLPDDLEEWCLYKHLIEYQVNTNDIVPLCLDRIGTLFKTELEAHAFVNKLRVPNAYAAYAEALEAISPIRSIIELGVGGDSAISTACFLAYLEKMIPRFEDTVILLSCDRNPLGMTEERYKDVPYWHFFQTDSVEFLGTCQKENVKSDMIFIDTIHSYGHTLRELGKATRLTNNVLLDDTTFKGNDFDKEPGGVERALDEFLKATNDWKPTYYADNTVCLLQRNAILNKERKV